MFAGMWTNWEGGCYALLIAEMSSEWVFDLYSEAARVSALFCSPMELLKHFLPLLLKDGLAAVECLICTLGTEFPNLLAVNVIFFKPGDPKCLCDWLVWGHQVGINWHHGILPLVLGSDPGMCDTGSHWDGKKQLSANHCYASYMTLYRGANAGLKLTWSLNIIIWI